jgi:hypothetical protein
MRLLDQKQRGPAQAKLRLFIAFLLSSLLLAFLHRANKDKGIRTEVISL